MRATPLSDICTFSENAANLQNFSLVLWWRSLLSHKTCSGTDRVNAKSSETVKMYLSHKKEKLKNREKTHINLFVYSHRDKLSQRHPPPHWNISVEDDYREMSRQ